MPSFNIFGIDVAGKNTAGIDCDRFELEARIDTLISKKNIKTIVINKQWV